jgi:hypothetical protein
MGRVNEPPYFGVPSLSHQFPATVVVEVVTVVAVDCVVVVVLVVVDVVVVLVVVDVGAVVVVLVQDAKTRDMAIRQVSTIQVIPLFI